LASPPQIISPFAPLGLSDISGSVFVNEREIGAARGAPFKARIGGHAAAAASAWLTAVD